ncbi:MAG: hypothetical protein Pars92KO_21180 [Parasphingorhabdus sp.]
MPGSMSDVFERLSIRPARCNIRSTLARRAACHRSLNLIRDLFDWGNALGQFRPRANVKGDWRELIFE